MEVTCSGGVSLVGAEARVGEYAPRYAEFAAAITLEVVARAEGAGHIDTRFVFSTH